MTTGDGVWPFGLLLLTAPLHVPVSWTVDQGGENRAMLQKLSFCQARTATPIITYRLRPPQNGITVLAREAD